MRFMTRGLMGLFLAGLTAALLMAAGMVVLSSLKQDKTAGHGSKSARERVFVVNVMQIEPTTATPVIRTFGEVISGRTLELRAASGGSLVKIADNFREGGLVHEGELLFQTDPATAQAKAQLSATELDEAKAELSEANEALGLAKDELRAAVHQYELRQQAYKRQKSLRERGIGTESALETAALSASSAEQASLAKRQSLANAKSRINRAKIALSRSQINHNEAQRILNDTSVTAKFDGVLSDVTGDLGGLVNANERLARLIDPNALEVAFRITSAEFMRMTAQNKSINSAKVIVKLNGTGEGVIAKIDRVSAAVGEGKTGRELFASLDSEKVSNARPGDFVSVTLEEPALDNVVILPSTAASATGDILVLGKNDRLEVMKVEILRKQADQIIVPIGKLKGREIVLERAPQLGAGIKVKPRRDEASENNDQTVPVSDELLQRMIAYVEANKKIPVDLKRSILGKLNSPKIPKETYDRITSRLGE